MKSGTLIELTIATLITTSSTAYCQKMARIEDLGNRVEKLWEVAIPMQWNKNYSSGILYALLKTGVAVLSSDRKTILCYDYNTGHLIWQVPNSSDGGLSSTVDGEYLFSSSGGEGGSDIAVYSSDGKQLWHSYHDCHFQISPSGKYLITIYGITTPCVLKVLEISTGKTLWQLNEDSWWDAGAGLNDRIAYYYSDKLKYFKLDTGELIWERPVEYDSTLDFGKVFISLQGNVIAYENSISTGITI
ncbi:MAG: PQQ-like beta-propeller repeat protein, partial [Anaerolineae bacterium]|nr:PQQ-like beta-propeller repeat protein [Anaerolineae bacterium]